MGFRKTFRRSKLSDKIDTAVRTEREDGRGKAHPFVTFGELENFSRHAAELEAEIVYWKDSCQELKEDAERERKARSWGTYEDYQKGQV